MNDEAHDLRRIEVLGHLDRVLLRHADALRVGPPDRQRTDAVSHSQPRAARAELLDYADELVAGRERRLRPARDICAGAELGIGERHAGGQNPDEDLALARSRIALLHHLQDLGSAEVIDDDTFHRCSTYAAGSAHRLLPSPAVVHPIVRPRGFTRGSSHSRTFKWIPRFAPGCHHWPPVFVMPACSAACATWAGPKVPLLMGRSTLRLPAGGVFTCWSRGGRRRNRRYARLVRRRIPPRRRCLLSLAFEGGREE